MKKIGIEMSNDLHKSIRIRAIELDKTVKGYILDLIKNDLEKKTSNSPLKLLWMSTF